MSVTKVTHRGIQWQRDSHERIRWWNEDQDLWVRWRPGDDAPPRPPGWEQDAEPAAPPPLTRPAWRSPYRVIPIILVLFIVSYGLYQALTADSTTSAAKETTEANAFVGKCLPKVGPSPNAGYATTPVDCSGVYAAGKVVSVVTFQEGAISCPAKTTPAILVGGASHPHFECIAALPAR